MQASMQLIRGGIGEEKSDSVTGETGIIFMLHQFPNRKKEPDMQDLWEELQKNFEQGIDINSIPVEQEQPIWVRKHEEKMIAEAEKGY